MVEPSPVVIEDSIVTLELASAVPVYEASREGPGKFVGYQVAFNPVVVRPSFLQKVVAGRPYALKFVLVEE